MNEMDVIYEYFNAEVRAKSLGLALAATRADFVLREARNSQEFARCPSLSEVEKALDRRFETLRGPGARG